MNEILRDMLSNYGLAEVDGWDDNVKLPKCAGLYAIISASAPNRLYIGSSVNIWKRRQYHLGLLRRNIHHSHKLQRHYNKYGEGDLTFQTWGVCGPSALIPLEQALIDIFKPYFNECPIAGTNRGIRRSSETRRKLSEANKGQIPWIKGRGHSEETKRKISEARKGKKLSPKQIEQIRERSRGNNYHTGHKLSDESKAKISLARKGKPLSEQARKNISVGMIGRHVAAETRDKIRRAHVGRVFSEETIKKMSDGQKRRTSRLPAPPISDKTRAKMSISAKRRQDKSRTAIRELLLQRRHLRDTYTIGKLSVDGEVFCDTLEDRVRDINKDGDLLDAGEGKVYGETAIPYGRYRVIVTYSPKFKRDLPILMDVPHFDGIRIHAANWPTELEGCIAVGENKVRGGLSNSRPYERQLTSWLKMWQDYGNEIWITIV